MHRLEYIDRIKGFAIILVVMGHILGFCLHQGFYLRDYTKEWLGYFDMPLFAFISGYLFDVTKISFQKIIIKIYRLLIPFVFWGLLFALCIERCSVCVFIFDFYKLGYWYLYVLAIFYCFFPLFKISLIDGYKGVFVEIITLFIIYYILNISSYYMPLNIQRILSYPLIQNIFIFFGLGLIVRKHNLWMSIFNNYGFALLNLLIYSILFVYFKESSSSISIIGKAAAVTSYISLFYCLRNKKLVINKYLEVCGQESMTIYLLHYFIYSVFPLWQFFHVTETTYPIEWMVALLLSLIIIFICYAIGQILKKNRVSHYLLTGVYDDNL